MVFAWFAHSLRSIAWNRAYLKSEAATVNLQGRVGEFGSGEVERLVPGSAGVNCVTSCHWTLRIFRQVVECRVLWRFRKGTKRKAARVSQVLMEAREEGGESLGFPGKAAEGCRSPRRYREDRGRRPLQVSLFQGRAWRLGLSGSREIDGVSQEMSSVTNLPVTGPRLNPSIACPAAIERFSKIPARPT